MRIGLGEDKAEKRESIVQSEHHSVRWKLAVKE